MEELDEFGIPIKKASTPKVDEFGIPVKKKDGTKPQSTSTTKVEKSVSVPTDGSLVTPKAKIKDERLEGVTVKENVTTTPKVKITDLGKLKESEERLRKLKQVELAKFRQSTQVNDNDIAEIQNELKAKKNNEGLWNKTVNFVKGFGVLGPNTIPVNPLESEMKEAENLLISQGIKKPTNQQISLNQ